MSLIENLDGPGWKNFLAGVFATTLDVLDGDAHRWAGSSVDDLRTWLRTGGLAHARGRLDEQAIRRGFSSEHRVEILHAFDELVVRHRARLVRLAVRGVLAASSATAPLRIELPRGVDVEDLLARAAVGERPFDAWIRANGHTEAEIAAVYEIIDAWLAAVFSADSRTN